MPQPFERRILGLQPYEEVRALQRELQADLIGGAGRETILFCEHPPVITRGKSSKRSDLLAAPAVLSAGGIEVIDVERGGEITAHEPGQLVVYPIIDLRTKKCDVAWYMRQLEEAVIRTLVQVQLETCRVRGCTGVWIGGGARSDSRKLCSIGVRLSRWCTLHGLALNVANGLETFSHITACGLTDVEMSSVNRELAAAGRPGVSADSLIDPLFMNLCAVLSPLS